MDTQYPMEMVVEATVERTQEVEDLVEEAGIQEVEDLEAETQEVEDLVEEVEDLVEEVVDGSPVEEDQDHQEDTPVEEVQGHQEDPEDMVGDGTPAVVDGTLVVEAQDHQVDHHLCPEQDSTTLMPRSPHSYATQI
jgi:hypothetical protein